MLNFLANVTADRLLCRDAPTERKAIREAEGNTVNGQKLIRATSSLILLKNTFKRCNVMSPQNQKHFSRRRIFIAVVSGAFSFAGLVLLQIDHSKESQFKSSFSSLFFSTPYYWQGGVGALCIIIGLALVFVRLPKKGLH
jgi:hypothetical protein